jgi:protein O-GlcNAc transferase
MHSLLVRAPAQLKAPIKVQVFVYDATPRQDSKSAYLRTAAEAAGCTWRRIATSSNDALAAMIRDDSIDVLVELTGHTAHNRLAAMCYQPAPVQMTWIGYPNSTGLEAVHYRYAPMLQLLYQ